MKMEKKERPEIVGKLTKLCRGLGLKVSLPSFPIFHKKEICSTMSTSCETKGVCLTSNISFLCSCSFSILWNVYDLQVDSSDSHGVYSIFLQNAETVALISPSHQGPKKSCFLFS